MDFLNFEFLKMYPLHPTFKKHPLTPQPTPNFSPRLTWRDIHHLAVWTADPEPIFTAQQQSSTTTDQWRINSIGLLYHTKLGFGIMNALRMAQEARHWTRVPELHTCHIRYAGRPYTVPADGGVVSLKFDGCDGHPEKEVLFVERVQLLADVDADFGGHLVIWLESPQGTRSRLIGYRPKDLSNASFPTQWPFTSVHFWGEQPAGRWRLHVRNANPWRNVQSRITLSNLSLKVWGTAEEPEHYRRLREEGLGLEDEGVGEMAGEAEDETRVDLLQAIDQGLRPLQSAGGAVGEDGDRYPPR